MGLKCIPCCFLYLRPEPCCIVAYAWHVCLILTTVVGEISGVSSPLGWVRLVGGPAGHYIFFKYGKKIQITEKFN